MWYNFFAKFYDRSLEKRYAPYRKIAIDKFNLPEGSQILDLPCGTGASLEGLMTMVGDAGFLVGVDNSEGMLKKAEKRLKKVNSDRVLLKNMPMSDISATWVDSLMGGRKFDGIFCSLGLTVLPDWEKSFETLFALLRDGGRFVLMDVYNESPDFQSKCVDFVAQSEMTRKVWLPLQKRCADFSREVVSSDCSKFGGELYIASGTKVSANDATPGCDNSGWNQASW